MFGKVVTDLVMILGLGIGIDYSLLIVYRYRDELRAAAGDRETAIVRTMQTTGRAVFFSGLTVALGISTLILTGVPFVQSLGLGGLLVPLSALIVTMTLRAGRFLIVNFNVLIRQTGRVLAGGKLSEAELEAYRGPFVERATRYHQHDLFRSITHSHDYLTDLQERLRKLSYIPVLLPWGDSDPTYKAGWLERYEQLFPRHRSLIIAGGGHVPQEDAPEQIAKAIREWWETDVAEPGKRTTPPKNE